MKAAAGRRSRLRCFGGSGLELPVILGGGAIACHGGGVCSGDGVPWVLRWLRLLRLWVSSHGGEGREKHRACGVARCLSSTKNEQRASARIRRECPRQGREGVDSGTLGDDAWLDWNRMHAPQHRGSTTAA